MSKDEAMRRIEAAFNAPRAGPRTTMKCWVEDGTHFCKNLRTHEVGRSEERLAVAYERADGTSEEKIQEMLSNE